MPKVAKKVNKMPPILYKSAPKWNNETKSFDKIDDSFKKIIIVRNPIVNRYSDKGYLIIGLIDFLLDENILSK